MRAALSISIIALLIGFVSCNKTLDREWVELHETTCSPSWVDYDRDSKTRKNLEGFLKGNGIVPLKIRIEGDRHTTCQYCDCTTGKVYRVQIDESQIGYMASMGFFPE